MNICFRNLNSINIQESYVCTKYQKPNKLRYINRDKTNKYVNVYMLLFAASMYI